MRRGLTLIEVVAATALLTLIVAASVPVLAAARRDLAASRSTGDRTDARTFERALDDLLRQRSTLVTELLEQPAGLDLRWDSGDHAYEATATVLTTTPAAGDEHRSSHCWALFRGDGVEALRWLRMPDPPKDGVP